MTGAGLPTGLLARRLGPLVGLSALVAVMAAGLAWLPTRAQVPALPPIPALVPMELDKVASWPPRPQPPARQHRAWVAAQPVGLAAAPGCTRGGQAPPLPSRAARGAARPLAAPPLMNRSSAALAESATVPSEPGPHARPSRAAVLPVLPFVEAHWQGIEALENTPTLARSLGIPPDARGVIVDEATMPADAAGFRAGDLITSVGQLPTPTLPAFIEATARVRSRRRVEVDLMRGGASMRLVLVAMRDRLGTANGETAQTIRPGARAPHDYLGPCTQCHRIGTRAQLAVDQGDALSKGAPPIRAGQTQPHKDRGECRACHQVQGPAGAAAPVIAADAPSPHESRGACSGCHRIQLSTPPRGL